MPAAVLFVPCLVMRTQLRTALVIEPGDTITWTWQGSEPHDVSGDGFRSEARTTGTFSHTFDRAREYQNFCTIHSGWPA